MTKDREWNLLGIGSGGWIVSLETRGKLGQGKETGGVRATRFGFESPKSGNRAF